MNTDHNNVIITLLITCNDFLYLPAFSILLHLCKVQLNYDTPEPWNTVSFNVST